MKYLNIHTHQFTNQNNILEIVNQYPQEIDDTIPFYSIGIHPWYIVENKVDNDLEIIERNLQIKNCLALGECGLDKRIEIPLETQIPVFEKQLLLAEKYKKPVIIHCVATFQEVIEIKKKLKIKVPMIIHGFSKNKQIADSLIKNDFYLSFGKYLLRNPELEKTFKNIPDNRIFLETDTIEETIKEVYNLAAKYKNIDLNKLEEIIRENFNFVFQSNIK